MQIQVVNVHFLHFDAIEDIIAQLFYNTKSSLLALLKRPSSVSCPLCGRVAEASHSKPVLNGCHFFAGQVAGFNLTSQTSPHRPFFYLLLRTPTWLYANALAGSTTEPGYSDKKIAKTYDHSFYIRICLKLC